MVEAIKQKDASHVQLIFSAAALDSETLNFLAAPGLSPESAFVRAMPMGVEEKAKSLGMEKVKLLAVNLKDLMEYFKGFKIEQIELWISGAAETSGLLSLAIAAKGEGGVKVVLKPSE